MRKRQTNDVVETKSGRIEDAMRRYGLGRGSMRALAKAAGAEIKIGRSYLINFSKVDEYLDQQSR